ncbi:MAG: hypothetical protein ACE5I5_06605 [Candidatus Heimdallarchaeota archaeon]
MKKTHALVIALIIVLGAGLFISGVMATISWPSMWGSHMTSEDSRVMMSDEEDCHEDSEGWYSHMEEHMDEEDCHGDSEN